MAQHDQNIANQLFPATRSDVNAALAALFSSSAGTSAPSTTVAGQLWLDTTNHILKIRNEANSAWLSLYDLANLSTFAPGPAGPTGPTGPAGPAGVPDYSLVVLKAGDTMTGTLNGTTAAFTTFNAGSGGFNGGSSGNTLTGFLKAQDYLQVMQLTSDNTDNPDIRLLQNDGVLLAQLYALTAAATATNDRGTVKLAARKSGVAAYKTWTFNANDGTLTCADGAVYAPDFIIPSDRRLKKDFEALSPVLEKVMKLKVKKYTRKGGGREVGLVAQEVKKVLPEMVTGEKTLAIKYGQMIPLLIAAIQEVVNARLNTRIA